DKTNKTTNNFNGTKQTKLRTTSTGQNKQNYEQLFYGTKHI
ncbi:MAG: hypothetical protein ACI9XB_003278, partial [Gammaproteobacteria bacterium]